MRLGRLIALGIAIVLLGSAAFAVQCRTGIYGRLCQRWSCARSLGKQSRSGVRLRRAAGGAGHPGWDRHAELDASSTPNHRVGTAS